MLFTYFVIQTCTLQYKFTSSLLDWVSLTMYKATYFILTSKKHGNIHTRT